MKPKLLYIIVLLLTVLICLSIEIQHQTDMQQISALTSKNATLTATIATLQCNIDELQSTVDKQAQELEQLKSQQSKPEPQKSDRSGERPRYALTDTERDLVERVVMAESGGESYEGQMLVAQCILNACEIDGIRPAEAIKKYVYTKGRPEPSDSVERAVSAVFDKGETVTDEPIVYFYAPGVVRSEFHERQRFVVELGGHRFFK